MTVSQKPSDRCRNCSKPVDSRNLYSDEGVCSEKCFHKVCENNCEECGDVAVRRSGRTDKLLCEFCLDEEEEAFNSNQNGGEAR